MSGRPLTSSGTGYSSNAITEVNPVKQVKPTTVQVDMRQYMKRDEIDYILYFPDLLIKTTLWLVFICIFMSLNW